MPARTSAATLAPFWNSSAGAAQRGGVLSKALRVARNLDDPGLATMLLAPFRVETLARGHAAPVAGLVGRYGEAGGRTFAVLVADHSWAWLRDRVDSSARGSMPSRRAQSLGELGPAVTAVLAGAAVCGAKDLRDEIVQFLSQDNDDLLACLIPALRAGATLNPQVRCESGLDDIGRLQLRAVYDARRLPARPGPAVVRLAARATGPSACPPRHRRGRQQREPDTG